MKVTPHIDRLGDIRRNLVDYFQNVLLKKDDVFADDFFKAVKKEFGNIEVKYDENEQLTDPFKSDWYIKTKKSMTPGDYIKIYRENRSWTQDELGNKLGGISRQYISDLEKGRRGISKDIAKKLAALFEVPVQRFI